MSDLTLSAAIENIYASLKADNAELDPHIAALKAAMAREGLKEAVFDPAKLAQNNRRAASSCRPISARSGVTVRFAE